MSDRSIQPQNPREVAMADQSHAKIRRAVDRIVATPPRAVGVTGAWLEMVDRLTEEVSSVAFDTDGDPAVVAIAIGAEAFRRLADWPTGMTGADRC